MTFLETSASGPLSDEVIVERVRAGEKALFEVLMRRNNQRVYRAARAILKSEVEAEDVMQDAYVRAYEHLADFEGRSRFSTWLTRIAIHEALGRVRAHKRHPWGELQEQSLMANSPTPSPEQQASDVEMRSLLERAVGKLSDEYHAVFVLRAVEGMSGAETAECLGVSEDVVKTRLSRARRQLQETLIESLEPKLSTVYELHLSRCDRVVAGVLARIGAV
jgi:RNA polymerase sigma-70 factor (ECF subfamily)